MEFLPLAQSLGLTPLTARTLLLRGIDSPESGKEFLEGGLSRLPDPFLLKDMDRAVDRLIRAVESGEGILVHGDYDVDGITGTALLVETLRAFGAHVEYFLPLRLKDGYGLAGSAMERASSQGFPVVLSVDCGVSAHVEARQAASLGLDLIITDHHQPPDPLPDACAIVNPLRPGCLFPFKKLAGVGVAFFLLVALRKALRERGFFKEGNEPDLRFGLDLVALGTIADVVPLAGVNRLLCRAGLALLDRGRRPGIDALKEAAGIKEVTCGAVAFRMAPRLNAAGRLEDAALGVELLLEGSRERAMETARLLDGFNKERQRIEAEVLRQAVNRLEEEGNEDQRTIVLADDRWHPGVIGIVASRLVERYHRPVVLIATENGRGKGSARSIRGFHLFKALQECQEYLLGFGGHEYAAGMTLDSDKIGLFARNFEQSAHRTLEEKDLLPSVLHDGEVLLSEINEDLVKELALLSPFGAGNPEPAFVAQGLRLQQIRPVGENHLRFIARQDGYTFPCIAFGMAERRAELEGENDLLFTPFLNEWKGRISVELRIRDFRAAGA